MKARRTLWPFVPPAMLLVMVSGLIVLARIASDDPSFAVEKDYYKKAVGWDAERARERESTRLGWRLDVETRRAPAGRVELVARLIDKHGAHIERAELGVEAFHNARAAEILVAELDETQGAYRAALPMRRSGVWELRFVATRGHERFSQVIRTEIPAETVQ